VLLQAITQDHPYLEATSFLNEMYIMTILKNIIFY